MHEMNQIITAIVSGIAAAFSVVGITVYFIKKWITTIETTLNKISSDYTTLKDDLNKVKSDDSLCRFEKKNVTEIRINDIDNDIEQQYKIIAEEQKKMQEVHHRLDEGEKRFGAIEVSVAKLSTDLNTVKNILVELSEYVKLAIEDKNKNEEV